MWTLVDRGRGVNVEDRCFVMSTLYTPLKMPANATEFRRNIKNFAHKFTQAQVQADQ